MKFIKFFLLFIFYLKLINAQDISLTYNVSMPKPSNHLFEVTLNIENIPESYEDYIDFNLPVWRSGRFVIFNFSSGVQEFSAFDGSKNQLKWIKTGKATWRVENSKSSNVIISYKVFSNEFGLRTRGLNDEYALIDPSAVLMFVENFRYNKLALNINPYGNWHVTTGLDKSNSDNIFTAPDYDYLADCPLLIGNQKDIEFTVEGKKHTASFLGNVNYSTSVITADLEKIISENSKFWGGLPYNNYTFLFLFTSDEFGGTEHMNSSIINVPSFYLEDKSHYVDFISVCSHEYFHTWNVKRLRPKGITPYDFMKENYTEELWVAEGTTSYYEHIILLRTGQEKSVEFISNLQKIMKNYESRPGNNIQSLAESSFDAWIKFWANTPNKWTSESDYYSKGAILSMLIDLEIRNDSKNKFSLDDVMKTMLERYALNKGGYTNSDFIKVCNEFAGKSIQPLFDKYLYSTDSIDWNKYLNYAGIKLIKSIKEEKSSAGISVYDEGNSLKISYVIPNSPAYDAGLDRGDEIIALNGFKVNSSSLDKRIESMIDGEIVKLAIMRNNELKEFNVTIKSTPVYEYKINNNENAGDLQITIYNSWLNSNWNEDFK
jgi:predicted metalloprotease with PDZ domain